MDFEDAPLDFIPKDVGSLFHLRYLSLRNTKVKLLPKSVGKFQNLETLDLKQSHVYEIPVDINNLRKLRHFIAYNRDFKIDFSLTQEKGVKLQKSIGCLKDLQKLYHVEANHEGAIDLITELESLRQLRKLGMKNLTRETGMALCASIEKMNHLESLDVASITKDKILDLQSISFPPQFLQHLYIQGRLDQLPNWIPKLQHLSRLLICWSRLSDDPLKAFQNLPNLMELRIFNQAYNGEQLQFEIGGFPKLRLLWLRHLDKLNSLIINEGALSLLEKLLIGPSPQLKEAPSGIKHVTSLKSIEFWDMPKDFEESLDPEQGSCHWIIEHVPIVYLCHMVKGYYDFDTRILHSKHLERSRGLTINHIDNHKDNNSNNINASVGQG